ncbi:MAG: phospholipase D family protein [Phycisphaerales bacterium]|nr:phospholipase D family protein [Phycisphaerales bacterium]
MNLVGSARERLLLCAPFVSTHAAELIERCCVSADAIGARSTILTDLSPRAVCDGATDPGAVVRLQRALPGCRVVHLPRLHAKVYLADGQRAIVTSGNLTAGGLRYNHECGVLLDAVSAVQRLEREILAYGALGCSLDSNALGEYSDLASSVVDAERREKRSATQAARKALAAALSQAESMLIRARLGGGPMHPVFERTILFLLTRSGPLPTTRLHPLVQQIHPDLCDDSVDRVIDGVHFGKKWKHAVRTAQQQLRKKGLVELVDGAWRLVR